MILLLKVIINIFIFYFSRPTLELLRQLFTRQNNDGDTFVVAALRYWCRDYEDKLGELLANLLSTRYPATSPNKRKRAGAKQNQQQSGPPTGEQVLGHLDQLRQHCRASADLQLYQTEGMQKALQQAQAASSDSLRKSYGDLFALAEVNEENEPPPPPTSSRKHNASATASAKAAGHRKIISTRERTASKRPPPRDRNSDSTDQSSEVNYLFFFPSIETLSFGVSTISRNNLIQSSSTNEYQQSHKLRMSNQRSEI